MKTFIAGSPISTHVGLSCVSTGDPSSRRDAHRPLLADLLARSSLRRAGSSSRPTGSPQASGSGPSVIRFVVGCGSAPSDPRRTYYIGNQGIRKPEKIRKIEKAWFNHPITNSLRLHTQSSGELQLAGERRADASPWRVYHGDIVKAWPSRQVPPCSPFPRRTLGKKPGWKQAFRCLTSPFVRGWTLETFPSRSERSGSTVGNGHAGKEVRRHFSDVLRPPAKICVPLGFCCGRAEIYCVQRAPPYSSHSPSRPPLPVLGRKVSSRLDPCKSSLSPLFHLHGMPGRNAQQAHDHSVKLGKTLDPPKGSTPILPRNRSEAK